MVSISDWFTERLEILKNDSWFQAECFIIGMEEIYSIDFFEEE